MAQTDSGMGWNANSDYMLSGAVKFGDLREPIKPRYIIPLIANNQITHDNIVSHGLLIGYDSNNNPTYIVTANPDNDNRIIGINWCDGGRPVNLIATNAAVSRNNSFYTATDDGSTGVNNWISINFGGLDPALGLAYRDVLWFPPGVTTPAWTDYPHYGYPQGYTDAITQMQGDTIECYKLNPNYAVTCFASWWTPAGTHLISPILISSDISSIVISPDGITPYDPITVEHYMYKQIQFHIAMLPGIDADGYSATSIYPILHLEQFGAALLSKIFSLIVSSSYANIQISDVPDPYSQQGGESEEDGGNGEDPDDEPVEEETLPLPSIAGLGFCTIYVPDETDLYNLAAYLWGGNLDLNTFLKLFANPMDSILGLSAVPVSLPGSPSSVYMGGQILTGITLPRYTGRTSVKVDMGTMTIKERWGAYLDYDPYTELSLYLPFIGIKNIKADDVMGKTISLMYSLDILSGACIAYIRPIGGSVLYEWSGQCALQIPITGQNWDNIFSTAATTAAAIGSALFSPSAISAGAIASSAVQAVSAKPRVERSGAVNGITGFLGQLRPYLIRVIPDTYIPANQNKFIGYPSFVTINLSSLSGYNEISSIHIEGIPATGNELSEIETLLKGGVIF